MSVLIDRQGVLLEVAGEPLTYVRGGVVTFDRRWSPYIQGQITVAEPSDLSVVDPRTAPRLVLRLTQRFGPLLQFVADLSEHFGGLMATVADVSAEWAGLTLGDISSTPGRWYDDPHEPTSLRIVAVIRGRQRTGDGTVQLTFEGIESRFRDYYLGPAPLFLSLLNLRGIYDQIRGAGLAVPPGTGASDFALAPGPDFDVSIAADDETGRVTAAGADVYARMEPLLTAVGARLWGDEDGRVRLTSASDTDTRELRLEAPRVVDAQESIDMDDAAFADSVWIEYKAGTTSENGYATFYYQPDLGTPVKTVKWEFEGASPVYNWNFDTIVSAIAAPIVERLRRRGRVLPVTAVADYTARPDQTATITGIPGTPDLTGVVSAVTFDFDRGEMTVTAENLEEITTP